MSKKSKTAGLEQFKMEAAREVGVTLGQGYNGDCPPTGRPRA